jgi:transcriptional regulator with XRE-family HTH domain
MKYCITTGEHPMNQNPSVLASEVPLHVLLRRRREELSLPQAQVAAALRVSPECVTQWELGRRRMELSKLPRIAAALQIDAKTLCMKALEEFHPLVHAALFGKEADASKTPQKPV